MERSIRYDRATRDFAAYVEGVLIGFFGSYHAAEVACNEFVYEALTHTNACAGFGCVDTCGDCAPPADWPRDLATGKPMDWYAAKAASEVAA
jgi:hypothetical protein